MQVGARYYDPATGSFLTRDTDLSQLAYVYCGDDPINMLDPSGHGPWGDIGSVVGAVAGGVIGFWASGGIPIVAIGGAGLGWAIGGSIGYYIDYMIWQNGIYNQKIYEIQHGIATSEADASERNYNQSILHDLPPINHLIWHFSQDWYHNPIPGPCPIH